jgi:hypothetical protein
MLIIKKVFSIIFFTEYELGPCLQPKKEVLPLQTEKFFFSVRVSLFSQKGFLYSNFGLVTANLGIRCIGLFGFLYSNFGLVIVNF